MPLSALLPETPDLFRPYRLEDARSDARAAGSALPTGFVELERAGFQFRRGKVYVVAARPGEGKTTLMLNLLMRHVEQRSEGSQHPTTVHVAGDTPWNTLGGPALYISYEDSRHHTYAKLLMRQVAVDRVRRGEGAGAPPHIEVERFLSTGSVAPSAHASRWQSELRTAASRLDAYQDQGLFALVDGDRAGGDVETLLGAIRLAAQAGVPSLVIIDYFQKMRVAREYRGAPRQVQLQIIADLLRTYSKGEWQGKSTPGFSVPLLVGAQVNRRAVRGLPELDHIREADDLANDASGVITLHRPEKDEGRTLQCKVVKNREGERDVSFDMDFSGSCCAVFDKEQAGQPATGKPRLTVKGAM